MGVVFVALLGDGNVDHTRAFFCSQAHGHVGTFAVNSVNNHRERGARCFEPPLGLPGEGGYLPSTSELRSK